MTPELGWLLFWVALGATLLVIAEIRDGGKKEEK